MLSRVAHSLYWLSRYIERAENLSRLVDVNRKISLDSRSLGFAAEDQWAGVLQVICMEEAYGEASSVDPERFITLDSSNPDSIRACIAMARENARMVRDQIPQEMWLELNRIHLYLQNESESVWNYDPASLFRRVIDFSLLFQGLT
ncbi:MAG: alpha-E domain-containing protein, partial [Verrucomicrobiota bacterium]